ncbi:MAG TPA: hypothetical protein PLP86_06365 [Armatimonadota bacterium]|nr:hypothetical protein [Armatimonadota bacterium]HOM71853.1 hypothetical protein [Armatimonadota bacterium]
MADQEDIAEEDLEDEELSDEEEPHTQRFSVVVVWSPESKERISQDEVESAIYDVISDIDGDVTVDVVEITEPTY